MTDPLKKRQPKLSRHKEITQQLRNDILLGKWAPGDVLPTVRDFAKALNTSYFTVQTALTPLEEEGLLERKRRVGMIVRHNAAILRCGGIYCRGSLLDEWENAFARELCRQLQRQLGARNITNRIYLDTRPKTLRDEAPHDLLRDIKKHEIQALFVPLCDSYDLKFLSKLPISSSLSTSTITPNWVGSSYRQFAEITLARMKDLGCHTIGLISPVKRNDNDPAHSFYAQFSQVCQKQGFALEERWLYTLTGDSASHERFGYESFKTLWQQEQHPDGLIVFPDTTARGVMAATLELGITVPDDIRMIFHRNTNINWVCPIPVDWIVSDVSKWAQGMIDQVLRQKAGEIVEPLFLDYTLEITPGGRDQQFPPLVLCHKTIRPRKPALQ